MVAPEPLLDEGFHQMYNLDFVAAHRTFGEFMRANPLNPMGPAADAAAYLFAELDRLHILQAEFFLHDQDFRAARRLSPDAVVQRNLQRQLTKAEQLAHQALSRNPKDANALFASVLVMGLRSDYEGLIEKRYLKALSTTKAGRAMADKLLDIDPEYYDGWLAIGVENYLLSLKPLPLRWLLRLSGNATDRKLGLVKLQITADKGHYFKPFAQLLLAVAALRDRDTKRAKGILRELHEKFPGNRLYAEELARLEGR